MKATSSISGKSGFTLIELMIAGGILAILTLVFLEGIILAQKIAKENSERLAAEAFAFDLAWMKFNAPYKDLETGLPAAARDGAGAQGDPLAGATNALSAGVSHFYSVADNVPVLSCWRDARAWTSVSRSGLDGVVIRAGVEWGPGNSRRVEHRVFRGKLTRGPEEH